ncbi:MAG: 4-hydroxythreonine-4-phosphate dehydrogenase PdxA [Granulosicoccus sp.]|nr:4-hydroxythreonine-4-phosphate dehydrogenase PdxA [Granulosicoccus sp.]
MVAPLRIALTPGEPAGIGPDLCVMLAQNERPYELVVCADPELLSSRATQLGMSLDIRTYDPDNNPVGDAAGSLCVNPIALNSPATAGELNAENSSYVLKTIDTAVRGCMQEEFTGMVTGPVHKAIINDAGTAFTGHTEYIAATTGGKPVMLLVADSLRVAIATTHIPVRAVPDALNETLLCDILEVMHQDMQEKFGIEQPRLLVCGLNPHAGESGHIGREEIDIIAPAIEACKQKGMNITGPLPADTLFTQRHLKDGDAVLAMFHDQGLPVLKYAGFGTAVNVTLGLPIIRTSVDHGTALDLAGSGKVDTGSLNAAIELAVSLSMHSR